MAGPPSRDVSRRTWDTEAFEARAAARRAAEAAESGGADSARRRKPPPAASHRIAPPAAQTDDDPFAPTRAWLRPRATLPDLDARVGAVSVVSAAAAAGFRCGVCDVVLNDSNRYVAHINSCRHQKRLGVSMRVRRSTPDEVRAAFAAAVRRRDRLAAAGERGGERDVGDARS